MAQTYRKTLKQAWDITRKNPFLWLLGVFATFAVNTSVYEASFQNIRTLFESKNFFADIQAFYTGRVSDSVLAFAGQSGIDPTQSLIIFILVLGTGLFLIYLTTISEIGIIQSVNHSYHRRKTSLQKALSDSHEHFFSVLILNIIARIVLVLVFLLLSAPIYFALIQGTTSSVVFSTLAFFIIYIPLSLIIAFVTMYAVNFIVLKDNDVLGAVGEGWNLFRKNFLLSVEIGITLLLVKLLAVFATILVAGIVFVPIALVISILLAVDQILLFTLLLVLAIIILLTAYIFINAFFTAYYLSSWTVLFIGLTENTLMSKLSRLVSAVLNKFVLKRAQKREVKKVAKEAQVSGKDLIDTIEKRAKQAEPKVKKLIKEVADKYDIEKEDLEKLKENVTEVVEKESEAIVPTLQKVASQLKKDYKKTAKEAAPKIKKTVNKVSKEITKQYPKAASALKDIQKTYREELAKDLKEVLKEGEKTITKPKKKSTKKSKTSTPKKKSSGKKKGSSSQRGTKTKGKKKSTTSKKSSKSSTKKKTSTKKKSTGKKSASSSRTKKSKKK